MNEKEENEYHEAGHALCSFLDNKKIEYATIIPNQKNTRKKKM